MQTFVDEHQNEVISRNKNYTHHVFFKKNETRIWMFTSIIIMDYSGLTVSNFISYNSYQLHCCTLPDKHCLSRGMCLYQVMMTLHWLNDVVNDAELTQKSIITSYSLVWRVNQLGKLINRIPGARLLISNFPGSASRIHVESLGKRRDVNNCSRSLAW